MGVSGSGKSTIGALLAHALALPFVDADGLHPQTNIEKMAGGVPLTDDDRWPWLTLVGETLAQAGAAGTGLVIACSALKRAYRDAILEAAPEVRFVHLDGSIEVLAQRLEGRSEHFMPPALLRSQLATLQELQTDEPGCVVSIDQPVAHVVAEAAARLRAPALPAGVQVGLGQNGLPVVRVATAAATAEVYLQGAHLTGWTPAGQGPVLWLSEQSEFAAGRPIRGGVPLCFPWFGPAADATAPLHGFARITDWQLVEAQAEDDEVVLVFRLTDSVSTRASIWPHRFDARYTVRIGARLGLALTVTNLDTVPVSFAEAFHTYLSVPDVHTVQISGFEDLPFLDRLAAPEDQPAEGHPITITGETDRLYLSTDATARLNDGAGLHLAMSTEGSKSRVVWNPWQEKAAVMADFGAEEWTGMVCVETANVRSDEITLAPGESHTMSAHIAPVD
jgi:carbohydrate kinase (thermoresistant glucokinase family)